MEPPIVGFAGQVYINRSRLTRSQAEDEGKRGKLRQTEAYSGRLPSECQPPFSGTLRIRRWAQYLTMLDALYRVGLDSVFLVAGKIDIGEDQQCLRAIGD